MVIFACAMRQNRTHLLDMAQCHGVNSANDSGGECFNTSASTNSNTHAVVVWEYNSREENWLPYTPAVSQHLERAYVKKLTRVLLSDADPNLDKFYVNIRTMSQESDDDRGEGVVGVRRMFYLPNTPAGKGTKWERAGSTAGEWHPYSMNIQCIIESFWIKGEETLDLFHLIGFPFTINFCNLTQTRQPNGFVRSIRRSQQAPYPLVKLTRPQVAQLTAISYLEYGSSEGYCLPKITMKSQNKIIHKALADTTFLKNRHSLQKPQHHQKSTKRNGELSATNLRQIFNNLNIFSGNKNTINNNSSSATGTTTGAITHSHSKDLLGFVHSTNDSPSTMDPYYSLRFSEVSTRSQCSSTMSSTHRSSSGGTHTSDSNSINYYRRPSVDTVSTYLSHESKDSLHCRNFSTSVNDLVDCSSAGSSDEVFLPTLKPTNGQRTTKMLPNTSTLSLSRQRQNINESIVGVDVDSDMISRFVKVVRPPKWPNTQPCPMCLEELVHNTQNPAIALSRCQHLMHLQCLNGMMITQQNELNKNLFIECPVCGIIYGEKIGNQPDGTMSWSILNKSLPGHESQNTIQIVYDIASGIQTNEHPHPGRAYFAVGFPRICFLPDCPLGRKVLRFLKIAFDRRLLFSIGRSVTTGREDVIIWNSVDHKTQFNMFPDPTYLQRCLQQLIHLGVTD